MSKFSLVHVKTFRTFGFAKGAQSRTNVEKKETQSVLKIGNEKPEIENAKLVCLPEKIGIGKNIEQ